jgi:hypothetical protein
LKRIKKKFVAVILAVNMLVIGIFGSYQTAQAAEIVAGYGAAQILESILLSFGISIFTADMIKNGSSATWWDTDGSAALKPYYDDLEQAYEEQRFKVINGGGGQNPEPSPTPAPGSTPIPFPTTVPVPGDIPTFKELVAPAIAGTAAVINMTQGAWECMGKAVSSLWNKMVGYVSPESLDSSLPSVYANYIASGGYPYYAYCKKLDIFYLFGKGSYICKTGGFDISNGYIEYQYGKEVKRGFGFFGLDTKLFTINNMPVLSDSEAAEYNKRFQKRIYGFIQICRILIKITVSWNILSKLLDLCRFLLVSS